ncbi:hypothetical protein [Pedobacter cryoconitis]|uniref:Uncharacterized protein n=1 Tax=Pedobacter cryoconitis TaxID=188932 RepID=A0A7X0IZX5_9SPHI|nr:hypothetical protein [Pedobacter cryoconitis]MBB6498486.1 hypothetical protein [Pedobacter cryoconitis]
MKKPIPGTILSVFITMSCLILFFAACRKDIVTNEKNAGVNELGIQEAKDYFYSSVLKKSGDKATSSTINTDEIPNALWDIARKKGTGVRVPLNFDSKLCYKIEGTTKTYSFNELTYLFLYKNEEGKMEVEKVTTIPDKEWVNNTSKDKKFTGLVTVEDWSGNLKQVFKYKDGRYRKLINQNGNNTTKTSTNKTEVNGSNGFNCTYIPGGYACIGAGGYDTCTPRPGRTVCGSQSGGEDEEYQDPKVDNKCTGCPGDSYVEPPVDYDKPSIEIIRDTLLKAKYPCVGKTILDGLEKNQLYNKMVEPFLQKGWRPNLTWSVSSQPWGGSTGSGTFSGAYTTVSDGSTKGMSSDIMLNSNMLENASKLLISAVAIHETYHAYVNFMFVNENQPDLVDKTSPGYMATFYELTLFNDRKDLNTNYTDHFTMLTSQFDRMVSILYDSNNGQIALDDCRKALLFGLDNPGEFPTYDKKTFINQAYNDLLSKYGFSRNSVDIFTSQNVNASSNNGWEKLGKDCK